LDPDNLICEPFGTDVSTDADYGIKGQIKYLLDSQDRYTSVLDYIAKGHDLGKELYLSNIYVPTQSFDLGFKTASGLVIKRSDGEPLKEWFSLHLQSALTLDTGELEGDYQLAVLSDDGAIVQVDTGSGYTNLINNDGAHATMMGCAPTKIHLKQGQPIPIKIDYYQGPRTEIALALMWRPFPSNPTQVQEKWCGYYGQSLYWDWSVTPSAPQPAYLEIEAKGWKKLNWRNFKMLSGKNKCVLARS
jgi:hypothetical protein